MSTRPGASRTAIRYHYDVGEDFYRLWLDETLTYSCAFWESESDSLEAAQLRKLDYHAAQARVRGAERVLDIGCGWGSLIERLLTSHQVRHVTGLTLSATQQAHIQLKCSPGVEIAGESWIDHAPAARYQAIISIGAFEHFARPSQSEAEKLAGYRAFFQRCHDWLEPGGWFSLQTMSYENSRSEDFSEFFATSIFPESDLPRLSEIAAACDGLFEVVTLRNDRAHYARTLAEWRKRLRARRADAIARVGPEVVARYDQYLQLAMIGFHVGTMGLLRLGLRRIDAPSANSPRARRRAD